jgi:hypothetical protein
MAALPSLTPRGVIDSSWGARKQSLLPRGGVGGRRPDEGERLVIDVPPALSPRGLVREQQRRVTSCVELIRRVV